MNKFLKNIAKVGFCLASVFAINLNVNAEGYKYPVYQGGEGWAAAQDRGALREMLEIPEDILTSMSTEDLIETVLAYPCFNDMYFYDSKQQGFKVLAETFNGARELLDRKDAASILLNKYDTIIRNQSKESNLKNIGSKETYDKICYKSNLEVLLAQPEISGDFTSIELESLDRLIANNQKYVRKLSTKITYKQNTYLDLLQEQQSDGSQVKAPRLIVYTPNGTAVYMFRRAKGMGSAVSNASGVVSSGYHQ